MSKKNRNFGNFHVIVRTEDGIRHIRQFYPFTDADGFYREFVGDAQGQEWSNVSGFERYAVIGDVHIFMFEGDSIKPFLKGSTATELDAVK